MRLPKINSLYGRIFAIFWFTMMLVLVAVLTLPHLDPRKTRDIPPKVTNACWNTATRLKTALGAKKT